MLPRTDNANPPGIDRPNSENPSANVPPDLGLNGSFGPWIPLESSNVEAVRYDAVEAILEVRFKNGYQYQYHSVPENIFQGMIASPSPGRYVRNVLRVRFPASRVR